ncbi:MAG: hypothetical protein GEU79_03725 [Acidimicrobiia bacterium]|nr:hypothetical protein [Acidimicrobiia bacterium]
MCGQIPMIGVVGPTDSVDLVLEVAHDRAVLEGVTGRAYSDIGEAVDLARELDEVCRVLLFTGLAPYSLASKESGWRSVLEYLPHSTVDLYRTLVEVIRDHQGDLPKLAIDTIELDEVVAAFGDLDLPAPDHVLALQGTEGDIRSVEDLVGDHVALHDSGQIEASLTCLRAVQDGLEDRGLTCYRVSHTRSAIQDTLRRAGLASMLARSEATQMAIALVEVPSVDPTTGEKAALYQTHRLRLNIQGALVDFAEALRGTLAPLDERTFIVHTTRGAVEDALHRYRLGQVSPIEPTDLPVEVSVGYGLGFSVADAGANAQRALGRARDTGVTHVYFSDGHGEEVTKDLRVRSVNDTTHRGVMPLGLGPLAFSRLLAALRRLDISNITTRDFATAYGVTPRSARRLFSQMEEAGVATGIETHVTSGRGRPPKHYRIDLDRLTDLASANREE